MVTHGITIPGCLENGQTIDYSVPVLPDSEVPGLFGLRSMEANDVILDTRVQHRKMYLGRDARIVPGPNTTTLQLYPAMSSHLMLPISEFHKMHGHSERLHLMTTQTHMTVGTQTTNIPMAKDVGPPRNWQ